MSRVLYENECHKTIATTSFPKTYHSVDSKLITTGKIPKSEKAILINFWEGDVVGYNQDYYKIVSDTVDDDNKTPYKPIQKKVNGNIEIHLKIRLLVDKNNTTGKISDNYSRIVNQDQVSSITKKEKERIRSVEMNLIKYNSSIFNASYMDEYCTRKWKNTQYRAHHPPCLLSLPETMRFLEANSIRPDKLIYLGYYIRQTHSSELQLFNITSNPFLYITPEWQLFKYDTAWSISNRNRLTIDPTQKKYAWIYSYLHEKNRFYIPCKDIEVDYNKQQFKINGNTPMALLSNDILKEKTIDGVKYYTTEYLMKFEKELGDQIVELFNDQTISLGISVAEIDQFIYEFETELNSNGLRFRFTLNQTQRKTVHISLTKRFAIITGFPGAGKSTILECVLYIRARINKIDNISISAPTGLAFKNIYDKLSRVTVRGEKIKLDDSASGTTHKCVYVNFPNICKNHKKERERERESEQKLTKDIIEYHMLRKYRENESGMTELNVMVIDEVSMLDIFIFKHVLDYCKIFGCQLILIGDSNQLPSVGPGSVLKSITESGIFEDNIMELNQICRQSTGALLNGILKMASGQVIGITDFDESSLYFCPIKKYEGDLFVPRLFELFEAHSLTKENTKVICYNSNPNKPINTSNLNIVLQSRYNPTGIVISSPYEGSSGDDKKKRFRLGDSIMFNQNSIQSDVGGNEIYRVNGDEAIIISIPSDSSNFVNIRYTTDSESSFTQISTNTLYGDYILSYALTVHKSQGSQYKNIVFIPGMNYYYIKKEVIFTAISRAKEKCFVLADMVKFKDAQTHISEKPTIFMSEFIKTKFTPMNI